MRSPGPQKQAGGAAGRVNLALHRHSLDFQRQPFFGGDAAGGVDLVPRGQHFLAHMGEQISLRADIAEFRRERLVIEMHRGPRAEIGALDEIKVRRAGGRA